MPFPRNSPPTPAPGKNPHQRTTPSQPVRKIKTGEETFRPVQRPERHRRQQGSRDPGNSPTPAGISGHRARGLRQRPLPREDDAAPARRRGCPCTQRMRPPGEPAGRPHQPRTAVPLSRTGPDALRPTQMATPPKNRREDGASAGDPQWPPSRWRPTGQGPTPQQLPSPPRSAWRGTGECSAGRWPPTGEA